MEFKDFEKILPSAEADAQAEAMKRAQEPVQAEAVQAAGMADPMLAWKRLSETHKRVIGGAVAAAVIVAGSFALIRGAGGDSPESSSSATETTLEEYEPRGAVADSVAEETGTTTIETTTTSTTVAVPAPPTTVVSPEVTALLVPAPENYSGLDCKANSFDILPNADTWIDPIANYCAELEGFEPAELYSWNSQVCDFNNYEGILYLKPGLDEPADCPPATVAPANQTSAGTSASATQESGECPEYYTYFTRGEKWDAQSYLISQGMTPYRAEMTTDRLVADYDPYSVPVGTPTRLPALPTLYCLYPVREQ